MINRLEGKLIQNYKGSSLIHQEIKESVSMDLKALILNHTTKGFSID
jgi:hypothetical protein